MVLFHNVLPVNSMITIAWFQKDNSDDEQVSTFHLIIVLISSNFLYGLCTRPPKQKTDIFNIRVTSTEKDLTWQLCAFTAFYKNHESLNHEISPQTNISYPLITRKEECYF